MLTGLRVGLWKFKIQNYRKGVRIGQGLSINHVNNIDVGSRVRFGRNVTVRINRLGVKKRLINGKIVQIASDCIIQDSSLLLVEVSKDNLDKMVLSIGDNVTLGANSQVSAKCSVVISDNVLLAPNVYISDHDHVYEDISRPINLQGNTAGRMLKIGQSSWIGRNACVMANVGCHSVIGANSVVTHDIPDYCVAVGIPARVVKRYDASLGEWVRNV